MDASKVPVVLTQREFDALSEYSCSLPTATTIGKRWKRNINAYNRGRICFSVLGIEFAFPYPDEWWMGGTASTKTPRKS